MARVKKKPTRKVPPDPSQIDKMTKASQPVKTATPLTPTELVEQQLPRTAYLSNEIQLQQILQ
jgi:uncharacterized protein YnzC (UPF0291/DUF896 family)